MQLNRAARTLPFYFFHALMLTVFLVPFSWSAIGICVASYALRMFAITAGYHRYFSHRSYKMNRIPQFLMAWLGSASLQKGVLWWAANHRHHHRFSDMPEDIHSPVQKGFWWSHVGWILAPDYEKTQWQYIQDLAKYPELRWINRWHLIPATTYALALLWLGGWTAVVWGFVVSTVLLWHGTFTINSLSHVIGSRRYQTTDTSRNNAILAFITLGEGWHNNHHAYMSSANQGFFWWEFDVSYYILRVMAWIGVAHDLRKPPLKNLESRRIIKPMPTKTSAIRIA